MKQEVLEAAKDPNSLLAMPVYVPSRSRWQRSLTLEALADKWPRVYLVVPSAQAAQYAPLALRAGAKLLPCKINGIAGVRMFIGQHAAEHGHSKICMTDDDLRFYRRAPESTSLHMFGEFDMQGMLLMVSRLLDRRSAGQAFRHVAVSARGGNNQLPYPLAINKRPLRVLAYDVEAFNACEHGRVAIMEDFDVTLQLIRKGFPNCVITQYAQDQVVTQMPGGCSDYRTHELHEKNVRKLAQLHEPFVKLTPKENKTGGEFGKRMEATIYWDKAFKSVLKEVMGG